MTYPDAQAALAQLDDDELLRRVQHDALSGEALALAVAELSRRGLAMPQIGPAAAEDLVSPTGQGLPQAWPASFEGSGVRDARPADDDYLGDMVLLVRQLDPTEAHLLAGLLQSMGIAAQAGDTQLVQTHSLWSIALGGANVRVPASQLEEAQAIHAAFLRGDFELDDNGGID